MEGIDIKPDKLAKVINDITLDNIGDYIRDKVILSGKVIKCDKNLNLFVDAGNSLTVKIPYGESELSRGKELKKVSIISKVGKTIQFVLTKVDKDVIGSRRLLQEMYLDYLKNSMVPGDIIEAVVINSERYGVFVDIGFGLIALIPTNCLSISMTNNADTMLEPGTTIRVILKSVIDDKVTVSYRENLGTWLENITFNIGETLIGEVKVINDKGVFVELSPNLSGLAESRDGIKVGDSVSVYVKKVIPEKLKVKLIVLSPSEYKYKREYKERLDKNIKHIDRWEYNPIDSEKHIVTEFNLQQ